MTRITVVSMKGWGGIGNSAAALMLRAMLYENGYSVDEVIFADDYIEEFRLCGQKIRSVTSSSFGGSMLSQQYCEILDELHGRLESDMTNDAGRLCDAVSRQEPDVVICTKGVIARMIVAFRKAGHLKKSLRVFNYVTNHGHFGLQIHQAAGVDLHITRLRAATKFLSGSGTAAPIKEVPYLTGTMDGPVPQWPEVTPIVNIIMVINRGAQFFYEVARQLSELKLASKLSVNIFTVDIDSETAYGKILSLTGFHDIKTFSKCGPKDYSRILSDFMSQPTVLVVKASPNAIAEAIRICMPVVTFSSGLPMEEWVPSWVTDLGSGLVGSTADDVAMLIENIANDTGLRTSLSEAARRAQSSELGASDRGVEDWARIFGTTNDFKK